MNPFDPGRAGRSDPGGLGAAPHVPQQPPSPALPKPGASQRALPLPCDAVEGDVVAYFDGEADDAAALRARRHLDACRECSRMWRDWGDSRLLLRSAPLPEVPIHWPASLVQRARLQALMPALFAPHAPQHHAEEAEVEEAAQPPRELRDAILARTTRAASGRLLPAALLPPEAAAPFADEDLARLRPAPLRHLPRRRQLTAARACLPALAAWMLVLASAPTPQEQPGGQPQSQASAQVKAAPLRSSSSGAIVQGDAGATPPATGSPALKLASRAWNSTQQAAARAQAQLAPEPARLGEVSSSGASAQAEPEARAQPRSAAAPSPHGAEPASGSAVPAGTASARGAASPREPERGLAPAPSPRALAPQPVRRASTPVSIATPAQLATPTFQPGAASVPTAAQGRLNTGASTSGAAVSIGESRQDDGARTAPVPAGPLGVAGHSEKDGSGEEAGAAGGEPLSLARELNDARPAELGDAIDDYAATYMDEGDASL